MRYRRNGDVIDFRTRRVTPDTSKAVEVAQYIADARQGRRGVTAARMSADLGISESDATRTLDGVASEGLLDVTRTVVKGEKVYARPLSASPPFDLEGSRRLGVAARARAAQVAQFRRGSVVVIRGGRRRYVIAVVEPNYGGEQTYHLTALSGGYAGSSPSGVRESELALAPSQDVRWEGVQAQKLYSTYAMATRMLEKADPLPFNRSNPKSTGLVYDRDMCLSKQSWEAQKVATFKERARNASHRCASVQKPGVVHSVEEGALYAHMGAERLWAEAAQAIWMRPETAGKIIKKAEAASQRGREADLAYHGCMAEIEAAKAKRAARGNPRRGSRRNPDEPPKPVGILNGTYEQHMAVARAADAYRDWLSDEIGRREAQYPDYNGRGLLQRMDAMEDLEAAQLRLAERARAAGPKTKPTVDMSKPITVKGPDGYVAVIHPWDSFFTMFGRYSGNEIIGSRSEKSRKFKSLGAAERAATMFFLKQQNRRNPQGDDLAMVRGLVEQLGGNRAFREGGREALKGAIFNNLMMVKDKSTPEFQHVARAFVKAGGNPGFLRIWGVSTTNPRRGRK